MASSYPIPATPRVISPSPTPSEASDRQQDGYFAPVTRSAAKSQRQTLSKQDPIHEEADPASSDDSLNQRARARSRSPRLTSADGTTRRLSGLTPVTKSEPLTNGKIPVPEPNGHLSPYARVQKSWRELSRSPSPLGLIPLHRHYRYLVHKYEIPRKLLHVSIGFLTLRLYATGVPTWNVPPYLMGALIPIASTDILRHRSAAFNRFYVKCLGALMRETEVDGYNGVIWYLLGTWIALKFYPTDIGIMSVLLLSWCDTAASTFGRLWGKYTIRLRRGKSLAGSLAAFATGALTGLFYWGWMVPRVQSSSDDLYNVYMFQNQLSLPTYARDLLGWTGSQGTIYGTTAVIVMSLSAGVIASVSELIDLFSWDDNLTIPVLSSAAMWAFLKVCG